jgi:hypothetical protein
VDTSTTSPSFGLPLTLLAVALIVYVLVSVPGLDPFPAYSNLAPIAALIVSRRRFQIPILSPTWISVLVFSTTGFFGYIYADALSGLAGGGIQLSLPALMRAQTAYLFAGASGLVFLASYLVMLFVRRPPTRLHVRSHAQNSSFWILLVSTTPLLMVVLSLGLSLLQRNTYLDGEGGSNLFGLGQQLAVAVVAILGYRAAVDKGGARFAAVALAVGYMALFFSLGSRRLALVSLCFAVGYAMAKRRHTFLVTAISIAVALLMLPLPLFLRGQSVHGLLPYLAALPKFDLFAVDWTTTANNVLIAFPISGFTAFATNQIPIGNLVIGLNPLPGNVAGWYGISGAMNLNLWTPFSMIGETANYGWAPFVVVWVGVGLALAWLELQISWFAARGIAIFGIAIVGLSALFAIQGIQYSVRTSTRLLEYAIEIAILGWMFVKLRRAKLPAYSPSEEADGFVSTSSR